MAKVSMDVKLDFANVLIRPKRSTLKSRSAVSLTRSLTFKHSNLTFTGVPIIAANMDTTGTFEMAEELAKHEMMTAIHKHYTAEQWREWKERRGGDDSVLPFIAASTIVLFAWIGVHTRSDLFVWDVCYGLFMAGFQTLFPAAIGSLVVDVNKMGIRNGMVLSIVSFAFLTGPPLGGALIQRAGGGYLYAQVFTGACFVVGLGFMLLARTCKVGFRLGVKA